MMAKWKLFGFVFGVVLGGVVFLTAFSTKPAPAVTFKDLSGRTFSMDSLKGRPVLINFWATSCPSCIRDMPHWVEMYQRERARGVQVIAVAMSYDNLDYIKVFSEARKLPFPVVYDATGELANAFGHIRLTPTTIWIERTGQWVETSIGDISLERVKAWLEKQYSQSI